MGSRYTATSLGTTNVESVVSVVDDLVSDRAIWRKLFCIVLCTLFVINAWAVISLHVINFTNETVLEVTVSVVVLLVGQYIACGLVDGFIYWRRWRQTSQKVHSKFQEENKEAWICMRITLNLLGFAPVARYIESLIVVRRMFQLEKQYMADAVAYAKEFKPPSTLPAGSLISAPATSVHPSSSHKMGSHLSMDPTRIRGLNAGLIKVQKVRRQFRRTERDAACVALASGVAGAGPFLISQGVLLFRRIGINFAMAQATVVGIVVCMATGIVWLCATLAHFYPASYEQSEVEHDRGIGQVPVGGLILLFTVHVIHVTMRCSAFILFTAQFYLIVLVVIGFHFFFVWIMLLVARSCTKQDYSNPVTIERSSISGNFLSDIMFAYVGLFEFANAQAKFTRTRYFLFYFFYYLENASMVGAWYVYFTYPEVWYYLPALLIITIVQLLGFILLQVYLYLYSQPRRKTTLCGLCFAHKDLDTNNQFPAARTQPNELESNLRAYGLSQSGGASGLGVPVSMISGRSDTNTGWTRAAPSGMCDPVFGQQISQLATPTKNRIRGKNRPARNPAARTQSEFSSIILPAASTISVSHQPEERVRSQRHGIRCGTPDRNRTSGVDKHRTTSSSQLELEVEAVTRHDETSNLAPNQIQPRADHLADGRRRRDMEYRPNHMEQQRPQSRYLPYATRSENNHSKKNAAEQPNTVTKGVFKPQANQGRVRPHWPYAGNDPR